MRRLTWILLLALALGGFALAEEGWPGDSLGTMRVVDCKEWVSLRASPDTSAEALRRVPLGMWVENCAPAGNGFVYCQYDDGGGSVGGYVLADYLRPAKFALRTAAEGTQGAPILDAASDFDSDRFYRTWSFSDERGAYTVRCAREYAMDSEALYASCFDSGDRFVWGLYTESVGMTELDATDAYLGGTADAPLALAYNFNLGLAAIDLTTGAPRWTVDHGQLDLGASQTHALGADGALYVGGYYGPAPVAISADGQVLWQSDPGPDAVWLYEMRVEDGALVAGYDAPDGDGYAQVVFDLSSGAVIEAR